METLPHHEAAIVAVYLRDDKTTIFDVSVETGVKMSRVYAVLKAPRRGAEPERGEEARLRALADPEVRARMSEARRHSSGARAPLPPMSPAERKLYQKLRSNGIPRDEALSSVLGAAA